MNVTTRRLIIAVFIAAVLFFVARQVRHLSIVGNWFTPKPVVVDQTPLMISEIKNIAQLMTVEAYNEIVVDSTRYPFGVSPKIFNVLPGHTLPFLGATHLVLIVKGKVVAGVDLNALSNENIRIKNDTLFVQLPPAKIVDVISNPSDVETFIEEGTWDEAAATALQLKARNRMVQQALAQGALQQANEKARNLVYGLLKNVGYKNVIVTTAIQVNPTSGKQ